MAHSTPNGRATTIDPSADFTGQVVGVIDDPDLERSGLVSDLLAAGAPGTGIHLYSRGNGETPLGAAGARHGALASVRRVFRAVVHDGDLRAARQAVDAGHLVVAVDTDGIDTGTLVRVLRRHGAHDMVHYGRYSWARLGPDR